MHFSPKSLVSSLGIAAFFILSSSCATRYMLDPDRETSYEVDGQDAQMAEADGCRVTAYAVKNDYKDLIAHVRVLNSSKKEFTVKPSHFSLAGPALKGDTVKAVEPDVYFKKLQSDAESLQKRSQLNTWDGVDTLTKTLPASEGKKDLEIEKVRKQYEESEKQKKKDLERSSELHRKKEELRPRLFETLVVHPGREAKGEILIPGPFAKTGKVTLTLDHPNCTAFLPYTLEK